MKHLFMGVVVPFSTLLPIFIASIRFRYLDAAAKTLLLYLCANGLLSILIYYMANVLHTNNLPLFHIGTFIEFILLVEVYKILLPLKKRMLNRQLLILQSLFLIACVVNAVFFQSLYIFNSYTRSLEALMIMLLTVNYFAKLFTGVVDVKIADLPSFWFNTGLFLYFSGAFMLFIFSNYLLAVPKSSFLIVWNTHAAFILLMYILFTIGFWKCKK